MGAGFEFERQEIPGLYAIKPFVARDERGAFIKDYSREAFSLNGVEYDLKEVFYTVSRKGVIRALHFQTVKEQPKLVRCLSGKVWDVVVDLRVDSPAFMRHQAFSLTGDNALELLVPCGCAHGYLVQEDSIVSYKCAEKFYGEYDGGVRWDDPQLSVPWPLETVGGREKLILSAKDGSLPTLEEFIRSTGGFRCA
jgi:dTDP-4-dehydrorhamnose 3,5-epimerase